MKHWLKQTQLQVNPKQRLEIDGFFINLHSCQCLRLHSRHSLQVQLPSYHICLNLQCFTRNSEERSHHQNEFVQVRTINKNLNLKKNAIRGEKKRWQPKYSNDLPWLYISVIISCLHPDGCCGQNKSNKSLRGTRVLKEGRKLPVCILISVCIYTGVYVELEIHIYIYTFVNTIYMYIYPII